jgi:transcriptional regulator with XRE-family HTH domain
MNPLSQQISMGRAAKKWSQRDLAKEMGVSQQTVAHWESGGMPRSNNYGKLRDLLGLDAVKPIGTHHGGPAFPQPDFIEDGVTIAQGHPGMSLRDYFAGQALAGDLEQGVEEDTGRWWHEPSKIAARAYAIADAMLEASQT